MHYPPVSCTNRRRRSKRSPRRSMSAWPSWRRGTGNCGRQRCARRCSRWFSPSAQGRERKGRRRCWPSGKRSTKRCPRAYGIRNSFMRSWERMPPRDRPSAGRSSLRLWRSLGQRHRARMTPSFARASFWTPSAASAHRNRTSGTARRSSSKTSTASASPSSSPT